MTATAQKMSSETTQGQQLFPLSVGSEQCSLNYMKRLTAVAISNILYLRNVFPEDCYGHRKLESLKLRILTEKGLNPSAKQIVNLVKGCFDAMEKKYLKQLTLGIYGDPSDPNELLEAYSFRFTYESSKMNISLEKSRKSQMICDESSGSELRQSTVKLLRSLIVMIQALDKLPTDCFFTMKLLYYDDITPPDYEPPGFMASDSDTFTFKGKPISVNAGEVKTSFHSVKVKIRTNQTQFEDFVGSDASEDCENQKHSQELIDDCDSLAIEDDNKTSSLPLAKPLTKSMESVTEKSAVTSEETTQWLTCNKQRNKDRSANSGQKSKENITSKVRDLVLEDKCEQSSRGSDATKRRVEYEVTQDSLFNAMPDKRFKSSRPLRENIGLGRRRR